MWRSSSASAGGTSLRAGSGGPESTGAAYVNFTASIEYPLGSTPQQITWAGGTVDGATAYNAANLLISDPLKLSTPIPKGEPFAVKTWRTVAANSRLLVTTDGSTVIQGGVSSPITAVDQVVAAASGLSDDTLNAGSPGSHNAGASNFFYPQLILGPTRLPSVIMLGTSRVYGVGDTGVNVDSPDRGSIARSIGPHFAYCNAGVTASTIQAFAGSYSRRAALMPYFSHAILEHGTNDEIAGRTLSDMQSDFATVIAALKSANPKLRIFLTTPEPRTDASNTTPNASESVRVSRADWIRSRGIANVDGYFEVGDAVADGHNGSLWGSGTYTGDGIHETLAGYQQIVAAAAIPHSSIKR
ncbi:SGNH/GDSL hydrolase family protein [Dongia sp.]|uniref:SGNH/GDSL hydrolase family protein n=1 Tax=Dongia sp. TaxID=1977262 RepID=UPI0037528673